MVVVNFCEKALPNFLFFIFRFIDKIFRVILAYFQFFGELCVKFVYKVK